MDKEEKIESVITEQVLTKTKVVETIESVENNITAEEFMLFFSNDIKLESPSKGSESHKEN